MEKDLLEKTLELIAGNTGVEFINLCNYLDEERINRAFNANPESPLVIVGLDDMRKLAENGLKLKTVLARPKTTYVKLPCELEILQQAVETVKKATGQISDVLEAQVKVEETRKQVGYLRHLEAYQKRDTAEIGQKARDQYGWEGTDEEIMSRLDSFNPEREMAVQFSGKIIPGVFCDIEGTLFDWNGKIRPEVIAMLEKYGGEGKAVALWSGGDPEEISRKLTANGMDRWPLLSKYDFHGCTVEIAIDDIPEKKLLKDYGIRAEVYVHHDPDGIYSS